MTKTWLVSDTHFMHRNMYRFENADGSRIRYWAADSDEGDELIRTLWNENIKPQDKVYHLGDVAIPRRGLKCLDGLHGRKILIRGNHDIFKMADYAKYFDDIRGTHKIDTLVLTHYPIHIDSIPHWCTGVVHGHIHQHTVLLPDGTPDIRFRNVCVEHTLGAPIEFDRVREDFITMR